MASRFLKSDIDDANAGLEMVGWTVAELLHAWANDAADIADLVVSGPMHRQQDGQHSSHQLGKRYKPDLIGIESLEPSPDSAPLFNLQKSNAEPAPQRC